MTYDNIKTKKKSFILSLENTFLEKLQEGGGGVKLTPPSPFRVNTFTNILSSVVQIMDGLQICSIFRGEFLGEKFFLSSVKENISQHY